FVKIEFNAILHKGGRDMKSLIITGAGSGLGRELALLYAKEGYHIILTGRTLDKLKAVEKEIELMKGKADSFSIDIVMKDEVKKFMDEASKSFNLIGLINNAGVGYFGPFENLSQ